MNRMGRPKTWPFTIVLYMSALNKKKKKKKNYKQWGKRVSFTMSVRAGRGERAKTKLSKKKCSEAVTERL